jgi:hypothetical protein
MKKLRLLECNLGAIVNCFTYTFLWAVKQEIDVGKIVKSRNITAEEEFVCP